MPFFSGENMTGGYGGADIINSCTINVNKGEIVAILGPNGAGKSTAMKAMLGLLNLKSGKISIDGKDISKLNPQDRVKEGISFVPQTRNVFTGLSVQENLEMGDFLRNENLEKEDIFGDAYEYLLEQFADETKKKGGEFFTPREVVKLLVNLSKPKEGMKISDPTCGSGGMLIVSRRYVQKNGGDVNNLTLEGQEANYGNVSMCKMNMVLHLSLIHI